MKQNHRMKQNQLIVARCAALLSIMWVAPAQATLIDRGNGLIYDDVLDITWLQDANLVNQTFTWDEAVMWAEDLVFGGFDDWRLPTALNQDGSGPCLGFNCTDSEMGHMFYTNLGGMVGEDLTGNQTSVDGVELFDIQSFYWSGTEAGPGLAWDFRFFGGLQFIDGKDFNNAAWAVRPGDVLAVPEPATGLLLAVGLFGLVAGAKGRRLRPC